jgi:membrane associated rhomboid family serine protease
MRRVVTGDDSVIVPAAPKELLAHATAAPSRPQVALLQPKSLEARRTAIPVLLTTGVIFAVAGALKFILGDESPLADFPLWMPVALFALSGVCLTVAILNMMQVRAMLAQKPRQREPAARSAKKA